MISSVGPNPRRRNLISMDRLSRLRKSNDVSESTALGLSQAWRTPDQRARIAMWRAATCPERRDACFREREVSKYGPWRVVQKASAKREKEEEKSVGIITTWQVVICVEHSVRIVMMTNLASSPLKSRNGRYEESLRAGNKGLGWIPRGKPHGQQVG